MLCTDMYLCCAPSTSYRILSCDDCFHSIYYNKSLSIQTLNLFDPFLNYGDTRCQDEIFFFFFLYMWVTYLIQSSSEGPGQALFAL